MIVDVDELKATLRIETDDEDDFLEGLIARAQDYCEAFCRCKFGEDAPGAVKQAVLLLAGHFNEYRTNEEKQVWLSVEMAIKRLLWPYRDVDKLI